MMTVTTTGDDDVQLKLLASLGAISGVSIDNDEFPLELPIGP